MDTGKEKRKYCIKKSFDTVRNAEDYIRYMHHIAAKYPFEKNHKIARGTYKCECLSWHLTSKYDNLSPATHDYCARQIELFSRGKKKQYIRYVNSLPDAQTHWLQKKDRIKTVRKENRKKKKEGQNPDAKS